MKINNIPDHIEENLGEWVRVNSNGGDSQVGKLESFTFDNGFTLRPALIGNPIIHNSGKSKPRYYLEEDKPVGVSSSFNRDL